MRSIANLVLSFILLIRTHAIGVLCPLRVEWFLTYPSPNCVWYTVGIGQTAPCPRTCSDRIVSRWTNVVPNPKT